MKLPFTSISSILLAISAFGQGADSPQGLRDEIRLHPADEYTAYTLRKNEFIISNYPANPLATWVEWGVTDRITINFDGEAFFGGLLIKPHLPYPSQYVRIKLWEQEKARPACAFESMYQYLWRESRQVDVDGLLIARKGSSWYNRFNFSWRWKEKTFFHFSAGETYSENLTLSNNDSLNPTGKKYNPSLSPDISLGFDYCPKPWMSAHLAGSYGSTFVYLDNVPRKYSLAYAFRFAPFYRWKWGFFRNCRIELAGLDFYFADAKKNIPLIAPGIPGGYIYWQWTCKK